MLTGLIASGLVTLLPPFLRFCVVFLMFSILSGELLRSVTWGALRPALRVPMGFLLGLTLYALVGWMCSLLGLSFTAYVTVLQGAAFALFAIFFVIAARHDPRRTTMLPAERGVQGLVLLAAAAIAVFFFLRPPVLSHVGDAYDHVGYLRAIATENRLFPQGVLAPPVEDNAVSPAADPRKGVLHPLLAAVAALADLEPAVLWRWLCVFLAPAAVLAFFGFARTLLPGAGYTLAAMALFFLFQGGVGTEFLANISYGQHFAMLVYWVLVTLVVAYGRDPTGGRLTAILLLVLGGSLIHFDVLIHFGLLMVAVVVFSRFFEWRPAAMIRLLAGSAVCAAVILVWKVTTSYQPGNLLHTHPQGLLYFFERGDAYFVPSPVELLKKNGLLFLVGLCMVPALLVLRTHRRSARMCLALAAPPLLIAMNPWLAPAVYKGGAYLLHRFLLNVPAFVITVLVLGSLIAWARSGNLPRKAAAVLALFVWGKVLLLVLGGWSGRAAGVGGSIGQSGPGGEMGELVEFMDRTLPAGSVVASDPVTSYILSAYTDARVVTVLHQHGTPGDPQPFDRLRSARAVISPLASQREAVRAINRYGVDYVVLNGSFPRPVHEYLADWDPADMAPVRQKLDGMTGFLKRVYASDRITLYAVTVDEPDRYTWFPTLPFMERPHAILSPCGTGTREPVHITGVAVEPPEALPGETVRLTVSYRRHDKPRSPLPLKLYVRLEDREYFARAKRYPGDKYVRRYRERRQASSFRRYRFDHVPFGGLLTADMWPLEKDIYETITLRLPIDLRETVYDLELKLVHDTLIPNFALRDLLFNDDSYGGEVCTRIRIRRALSR